MADFTRGAVTDLIAHQAFTHGTTQQIQSSDVTPTAGALWAQIWIRHGFSEVGANTNPGSFYIQTQGTAVDDMWVTAAQFTTFSGTNNESTIAGTEAAGETTLAVTAGEQAAQTVGELCYVNDATVADGEWHLVVDLPTDVVTIADALVHGKAANDEIINNAEVWTYQLDLSGVVTWRVLYIHNGTTGMNTVVHADYVEVTDFE